MVAYREASPNTDRRGTPREPAHDLSEIFCAGSRFARACMVRNLSRQGAMIEATAGDLPDRFVLTNHERPSRVVCEVVWRRDRLLGVRFLTPLRKLK